MNPILWLVKLIPIKWRWPIALVGAALLLLGAGAGGWKLHKWWVSDDKIVALQTQLEVQQKAHALELAMAKTNEREVVKYVDRIKIVKERGATIEKEVIKYVQADSLCSSLPGSFRVFHDVAAGSGAAPTDSFDLYAAAARVDLPTASRTIAANYTTCHELRETVLAIQAWACRDGLVSEEDKEAYCK